MKILLVEDDKNLCNLLQNTLEQRQYRVEVAIDGQEGWELAEIYPYDLILLDWMLPRLDGIRFCQQLRSRGHPAIQQPNQETPVLLMTALDAVTNKIIGLDAGADDYLVKPLDLEELQARIRALERRGRTQRSTLLEWEGLRLQPKNCDVTYLGRPIALTLKEYQLLELFLRHPDQIFSQGRLIEHLWRQEETPTENAVRAQIKSLRHKLKRAGAADVIETLYKLGYRLQRQAVAPRQAAKAEEQPATVLPDLGEVWQDCRDSYFDRVALIEQAVAALHRGAWTADLQHQAEREAHTLVGSLGSFGLDAASQRSRQIQQLLKQSTPLEQCHIDLLDTLLPALRQAMGEPPQGKSLLATQDMPRLSPIASRPSLSPTAPTLLIVDDDGSLANLLAAEAIPWGIQTAIALNLTQARQHIVQQPPGIVLLDLNLSESGERGLDFLMELQNWYPDLPVLVFTARDSLSDRIQATRSGCRGFLQKPVAPSQVLGAVSQALQQSHPNGSKLLIVDDDLPLLRLLQEVLGPEGYELTLLDQVQQFWTVLEQTAPDLLILDVNLQGCAPLVGASELELNGFDLCRVIRNDPQWGKLPILFLSASTAPETIQRGFEAGADDFLHKPVSAIELRTRIRKRLEQGQVRRQADRDELTGVSNRRKSFQDLTRLVRLAQRQQHPLSLAILDLDQFKKINDQYGHDMGDRVLNHFGNLLAQSFRQEDVVGRWGGEEFVVGLYGISKVEATQRLMDILQTFRQEAFVTRQGETFQVTFSGGVAQLMEHGTDLQTLYQAADMALYRAKAQGRNRILVATGQE